MFKETVPGQERSQQERHGLSQRDVDRIYEEAFRDDAEGSSDIGYELPKIIDRLLDEAGYRLEEADGLKERAGHRFAFGAVFQKKGESEEEADMVADVAIDFSVDREAGTATFTIVPLGVEPRQARPDEAERASEALGRVMTLRASTEQAAKMKKIAADAEREKEDRREEMRRLRAFAEAHQSRWLTPEDWEKNKEALRATPLPRVDRGEWTLEKTPAGWRFAWWDEGRSSLIDVIEFADKEG